MYLLKHYLLLKYRTESETRIKVKRLENCLLDLQRLGENNWKNFREFDTNSVKQSLLRELFDLNAGYN